MIDHLYATELQLPWPLDMIADSFYQNSCTRMLLEASMSERTC